MRSGRRSGPRKDNPQGENGKTEGDADTSTKPFVEHLEDLRTTVLWCAGFLLAGIVIAIPLAPYILESLKTPLRSAGKDPETFLLVTEVAGGFSVALRLMFWCAIIFAFPGIVVSVGRFVFPGLTRRERAAVTKGLGFAAILFVGGVSLGYFMTLPVALVMMFRINDWLGIACTFVQLADYVSFVLKLLLAFGISFELPVVVLVLGSLGIVTSSQLRNKRRHVIVGLLILAMFLTPQDPLTMILMAAPLIALYEACIWTIWAKERRPKASEENGE